MRLTLLVKRVLAGFHFLPSYPLEVITGMMRLGAWRKQYLPSAGSIQFPARYDLYAFLNDQVLHNEPVDYLEFGVYKGASVKRWLEMNNNPGSRFYGFDTFSGLPEDWKHFFDSTPKGAFDVGGAPPAFGDSRLQFIKGLFQDTVPEFLQSFRPANRMVLHLDADLYSSTLYVLAMFSGLLPVGSILVFDEFSSVQHEFSALEDYTSAFRRKYRVLAWAGKFYEQLAVEITA